MGSKNEAVRGTVAGMIEDGILDLQELAAEMRQWADNLEENFSHTEKYQSVGDAADTLEDVEKVEVPAFLSELNATAVLDTRKRPSRSTRRYNAVARLQAALEAVARVEGCPQIHMTDDQRDELDQLMDSLHETIDAAESVEFPGMYG